MRHSNANRKFGRISKVRKGLMNSLALALITEGRIKTTEAKAKELRPMVEKLVSYGKDDSQSARKVLVSKIGSIGAQKIVKDLSPKYATRAGGYTRITKLPRRLSDGSPMAVIEFV